MGIAIAKVSNGGRIEVPEELKLRDGSKVFIYSSRNSFFAKKISKPLVQKTFEAIVEPIRKRAQKAGIKKEDVEKAVLEIRAKKAMT